MSRLLFTDTWRGFLMYHILTQHNVGRSGNTCGDTPVGYSTEL